MAVSSLYGVGWRSFSLMTIARDDSSRLIGRVANRAGALVFCINMLVQRLAHVGVAQSLGFVLPHLLAVHSFVIGCIYVVPNWLRVGVFTVVTPLSASFCLQTSARQWSSPCTHQRERPVLAHPLSLTLQKKECNLQLCNFCRARRRLVGW